MWNAEGYSKVTGLNAHRDWVQAVDVSPDGTRIATGSDDKTVCVWSLSTSSSHPTDTSSLPARGSATPFGSATVRMAAPSSSSQSKSTQLIISPSPGPTIATSSLSYLTTAKSTVSTYPPGPRSRNGPFTVATRQGALHWQAMARSSQSLPQRTDESGLSPSILRTSGPWLSQRTTTL